MSPWVILLVAVGVSADAFAVALTSGLRLDRVRWRDCAVIASVFGVFQAVMPLLGWLLASGFAAYIERIDHWIAFGLLVLIGGRMIWEALRHGDEDAPGETVLSPRRLLVLALATSIDALAVGVSFAFLPVSIGGAVAVIGATTFVFAFVGVAIGRRVGARFGAPAEIVGGVILILIGTRILLDHLGVL